MSTDEETSRADWLALLQRCQSGEATCLFVLDRIERETAQQADRISELEAELNGWKIRYEEASFHVQRLRMECDKADLAITEIQLGKGNL